MEPLELPFWPQHYSDEEIGQWLIEAWMVCHGQAKLLPGRSIPKWLAKKLTAVHPTKESGSITLAPLESALRKVLVDSDRHAAGKMLREYMMVEAFHHAVVPKALRDEKRQAGTRRERRPDITTWIDHQIAHNPDAKSPDLWNLAPEYVTDQIGYRRFAARVTESRKKRASK